MVATSEAELLPTLEELGIGFVPFSPSEGGVGVAEEAGDMGGVDAQIEQRATGRHVTQVVGVPEGADGGRIGQPARAAGPVPEAQELAALGQGAVRPREEQGLVTAMLKYVLHVAGEVRGQGWRGRSRSASGCSGGLLVARPRPLRSPSSSR